MSAAGTSLNSVAVFCGSRAGTRRVYREAAAALGRGLAVRRIDIVYGGGNVGLMGALADAARGAGGRVIGVMPQHLVDREVAHQGLTELHVVADMHERKATIASRADAFVALPGGPGTMEEFFEAWVWRQLGLHRKPVALLSVDGYYEPLARFIEHVAAEGFMAEEYSEMLIVEREVDALLDRLHGTSGTVMQ